LSRPLLRPRRPIIRRRAVALETHEKLAGGPLTSPAEYARNGLVGPQPKAIGRGGGLVVPQSGSAVAAAQAVRVVPGLAGVAVGLPVPHRGAGGLKALGLGRRVQPRMQR